MSTAWAKVEEVFREQFYEPDMQAVRAVYAAIAAHRLPGPPVWLFDVAPPSSGKTEKLMPLKPAVGARIISHITPQTLLSGKVAGDGSLLTKIGPSGIIVWKDFSQVLSMPRKTKGPILADLRDIYDGYIRKEFGTGEPKEWSGRITIVAAATPDLDLHYSIFQTLGERFLQVRSRRPGGVKAALRAFEQKPTDLKARLSEAVKELFQPIWQGKPVSPKISQDQFCMIANLAEFVVRARTHVPRNGYSREILYMPEAEASPRLAQQLAQLAKGSALLDGRDSVNEVDMQLVRRVAFDSMPAARRAILDHLAGCTTPVSQAELARALSISEPSVLRQTEELMGLGLVDRTEAANGVDDLVDCRTIHISLSGRARDLLAGRAEE